MKIALPLIDKETRHNLLFHVNVLEKRTPPPPPPKKKRKKKRKEKYYYCAKLTNN